MPEPVEIRRLWYRLRLDDDGVHINTKPAIPWDNVAAFGAAPSLRTLGWVVLTRGVIAGRPCLHVCVRGDEYPRAARAVVFPFAAFLRGRSFGIAKNAKAIESVVSGWRERVPKIANTDDLGVWWYAQPESHPKPPKPPPPPPTTHERATKIGDELHDLQDQLRRIEARKKHGHPPA
jgi:hypothetical protein